MMSQAKLKALIAKAEATPARPANLSGKSSSKSRQGSSAVSKRLPDAGEQPCF